MIESSFRKPKLLTISAVVVAAFVLVVIVATGAWWWPPLRDGLATLVGRDAKAADQADDKALAVSPDFLELSPQAQRSMKLQIEPLRRDSRDRSLRIPGQVTEIPGVTHQDISANSTGTIAAIHAREGQVVAPGAPLFDIRLVHEESINVQLALLDSLAQLEVVRAEIARLEELEQARPGGILLKDLRVQRYDRARLEHTISSRRQALILMGLSEAAVDGFIEQHRAHDPNDQSQPPEHAKPLLEELVVQAPVKNSEADANKEMYIVENLEVKPGQHVEVGTLLCRLGNYQDLYIEGRAFERDISIVRHAMQERWKATAIIERHGANITQNNLEILYIDPSIDALSRSAKFYIKLANVLQSRRDVDGRTFVDWTYRPGQQIEIHVPTETFTDRLIVPVDAVARDGLRRFVFQVSDNMFVRREVTIDYLDEQFVVLSESDKHLEGASLAMNGAYQLQLALLNRRGGQAQDAHHGHTH